MWRPPDRTDRILELRPPFLPLSHAPLARPAACASQSQSHSRTLGGSKDEHCAAHGGKDQQGREKNGRARARRAYPIPARIASRRIASHQIVEHAMAHWQQQISYPLERRWSSSSYDTVVRTDSRAYSSPCSRHPDRPASLLPPHMLISPVVLRQANYYKKTQRTADPSGCLVDLCASGSEPLFHERETMDWAGRADKVACIQRRVAHGSSIAGIPAGASGTTTSTRAGATPTWRAPASNTPHGLGRVVLELLSSSGVWRNKCYRDSGRRAGEGSRRRSGHHARAPTGTKNLMRSLVSLSSLAMLASCLTIGRTTG
jgi:hypothetical protein